VVYFTADNHFGHANIIRLCGRPFRDVREMDERMISAWNERVQPSDDVYVVGDLIFRAADPASYLERLRGRKHLIVGNHDRDWIRKTGTDGYFVSVSQMESLSADGKKLVLCHYPMMEWDGYCGGTVHVFGHIHNNTDQPFFPLIADSPAMLNAGADVNHFAPVTLRELEENNRVFKELWKERRKENA